MNRWRHGAAVPAPLRRVSERLADALRAGPYARLLEEVTVLVGADDPRLAAAAPPEGARVVVPALRHRRPPPWAEALIRSADVVAVFDRSEAAGLRGCARGPVVILGIPTPQGTPGPGVPLDDAAASESLRALCAAEGLPLDAGGAGVTWIGGGSAAALAGAAEAWSQGRSVVALPGTPAHDMLRRGGVLATRTSLEVLEVTRLLLATPPLASAMGDRGRRRVTELERIDVVAGRLAEALLLAAS